MIVSHHMKYLSFLVLSCTFAHAADFVTGQAARFTIGQISFTAQATGSPSPATLGAAGGVAYANNTLFIVDSNRVQATPIQHRILIYRNIGAAIVPPTQSAPQGVACSVCLGGPETKEADLVLGQPDFSTINYGTTASSMRTPTGIATDGKILAVADTDNNRVLIWKTIPNSINQAADIVLGQANFTTVKQPPTVDNKSFRGPQGVWIQGTRFYVADTQNHRVMVWNNIPTTNNQPADFVLGQPNFTTAPEPNLINQKTDGTASNLLNPVAVTSDGQHLLITDLGHHRVLIWNTIPTQTAQPADVEIGQPDMAGSVANNNSALCASNGTNTITNTPTYPARCGKTLSFPRFALSDGKRLYIADGGNDRILVYSAIPTQNMPQPDAILGQADEFSDVITDSTDTFRPDANITRSAADTIRTPQSLAWDGANLYAADPYDRRVLVYTPGDIQLAPNSITNAFSRAVFAVGTVDLKDTAITANDTVTITIGKDSTVTGTDYKYTIQKADKLADIVNNLVALINKAPGDPNVFAIANTSNAEVVLAAKVGGAIGNNITLVVATSTSATITATASGATLYRGNSAAEVAPGTLVSLYGDNLSDTTATSSPDGNGRYPTTFGGVTVYMDGIKAPIFSVSKTQINTQVPFYVSDVNSVSTYAVIQHGNGTVTTTTAVNMPIVFANPGLLAQDGPDPRPAIAFHTSSHAVAVVDVGGTIKANDTGTITVNGVAYTYTVQSSDTLSSIENALIQLINKDPNSPVVASGSGQFNRIILTAIQTGPDGNGITIAASNSTSAQLVFTALQSATCCASTSGSQVTPDNPAAPGEIISVYATGIGILSGPDAAVAAMVEGRIYTGPVYATPNTPVDDAQLGGQTANVLNAGLIPGTVGIYEVQLQISTNLPDNPQTQLFIAQNVFTSNIVTIPVRTPAQP